ncbi:RHS repeat-associated core domain-containing protein [Pseudomonas sp. zfem004]|uniref:RHS repeat-associated core domain-containing protein n=1 Tax=Pseudomonas sp. zfem004 TaxID=3078199 RepID=UPI0029278A67|nr:RHS repeat-associated core domain-containing protein [Pseudomonas sp. zfem004]MDU9401186.1 RHS repeat-associated core domain-containing protein [Pseudomonas sp. zfem004]
MDTRLFYQKENLYTLIRSNTACSLLHAAGRAHAEHQKNALGSQSLLMATNEPGSVLQTCTTNGQTHSLSYSAYGDAAVDMPVTPMMMFNCQWYEPLTGCYPLGNGYRMFSPQLMRFCSADSLSPFDAGGINTYAYCSGDPINKTDPSGRMRNPTFKVPLPRPRPSTPQSRFTHPSQTAQSSLRHDIQPQQHSARDVHESYFLNRKPVSPVKARKARIKRLKQLYKRTVELRPLDTHETDIEALTSERWRIFEMGVHLDINGDTEAAAFAWGYAHHLSPLTTDERLKIGLNNHPEIHAEIYKPPSFYEGAHTRQLIGRLASRLRAK